MTSTTDVTQGPPPTLDHIIGQSRAVEQLRTAVEALCTDRAAAEPGQAVTLPHTLLTGPPGVGKSMLAELCAREVGARCHEELAQNLLSPAHVHGLLMMADEGDLIFVDEIAELHPIAQTTLYRALEEGKVFLPSGQHGQGQTIELPQFCFVGATTDEWRLSLPLRHRFRLIARLERYTEAEMAKVLLQRAQRLGWSVSEAAAEELAKRARGTPRIGLRLLEAARRSARAEGAEAIDAEHVEKMTRVEGLDSLGLDPLERDYLRLLSEAQGPVRLNVLATRLSMPRQTVERVVESDLVRLGLVAKDDAGRQLTPEGRRHLDRSSG